MQLDPILLHNGPGPLLAYVPAPDADALAAAVIALANADGGAVIIGLDADGTYTGPPDPVAAARARDAAMGRCNPPIPLGPPEAITTPHGPALAIRVPRGVTVHALHDGRVFTRTATGDNRLLNGDEIRALISARASGDFERESVPGARIADLDPALLVDFMNARKRRTGQPWHADDIPLAELGAITPDHQVTVAGMLLFGRDPQRWLPHSGARFVRVLDRSHVAFERTISGPLVRLVDRLGDLVREQIGSTAAYPPVAVRETLINAVCHRDYRLRTDCIDVRLSPGQLAITSPGGLPGPLTTEHLIDGRYSRNPRLTACLHAWGYIERPGDGIWTILDSMDGHEPTELIAQPYSFTVRLYAAADASGGGGDAGGLDHLNERQRSALAYVGEHGSITFHEYRALCPALRPDLLQTDLSTLVTEGRLRKVGPRTGAYYILP